MTTQTTNGTQWVQPRRLRKLVGFFVNALLGIVLAVLTYKALSVLPSFYQEMHGQAIIKHLPVSVATFNLIVALLVAVLYIVHPLLGSGFALLSLFPSLLLVKNDQLSCNRIDCQGNRQVDLAVSAPRLANIRVKASVGIVYLYRRVFPVCHIDCVC